MLMAHRDRDESLYFVFCDDSSDVDKTERWGMKIEMIWMIGANMSNQGCDLPDCV